MCSVAEKLQHLFFFFLQRIRKFICQPQSLESETNAFLTQMLGFFIFSLDWILMNLGREATVVPSRRVWKWIPLIQGWTACIMPDLAKHPTRPWMKDAGNSNIPIMAEWKLPPAALLNSRLAFVVTGFLEGGKWGFFKTVALQRWLQLQGVVVLC